jgi:hypothetical protein
MTEGESKLVVFQMGKAGGFMTKLFEAMFVADADNMDKMRRGFPEEVEAVRNYKYKAGYWEALQEEWKQKWQS